MSLLRWITKKRLPESATAIAATPGKPKAGEIAQIAEIAVARSQNRKFVSIKQTLFATGFTLEMLKHGQEQWQQPFCQADLDDIAAGILSVNHVRRYLKLWKWQNPERFEKLQELSGEATAPAALDWLQSLAGLPLAREDREYLYRALGMATSSQKDKAMQFYRGCWQDAAAAEPLPVRKDNAGRRAANAWLGQYVLNLSEGEAA